VFLHKKRTFVGGWSNGGVNLFGFAGKTSEKEKEGTSLDTRWSFGQRKKFQGKKRAMAEKNRSGRKSFVKRPREGGKITEERTITTTGWGGGKGNLPFMKNALATP